MDINIETKEFKFKIYKHTSPSGKVYIGLTQQENVIQRWRNGGKGYFRQNKDGSYQQPAMVNAINKYPWEEWKHEIIDICDSLEKADELEKYYINLYNSTDPKFGYNITKGGKGHFGQPMKQETKEKLSEINKIKWKDPIYRENIINKLKGKKLSVEHRLKLIAANTGRKCSEKLKKKLSEKFSIPILQFDINGNLIAEYISQKEASQNLNITVAAINNACIGKTKSCQGFIFIVKQEYEQNSEVLQQKIKEFKDKKPSRAIPILQYDKDNKLINEFSSGVEASKQTGISKTSISNCLKGLSKTAGGYIWKYK